MTKLVFELQRQFMLICVVELLQDQDIADIKARFPVSAFCFNVSLYLVITRELDDLSSLISVWLDNKLSQGFVDTLLLGAKNHNPFKFTQLPSSVFFGDRRCHINDVPVLAHNNIFVKGVLYDVFF